MLSVTDFTSEDYKGFTAILMDPPWKIGEKGQGITPKDLKDLPITDELIPKGFLFIWVEKEVIHEVTHSPRNANHSHHLLLSQVIKQAEKWRFKYVENMAWVQQTVNNRLRREDYKYFQKSKLSLLIFRLLLASFFLLLDTHPPQHLQERRRDAIAAPKDS